MQIGVVAAFVAGLLTFLAPCTLPIVPGYIGFISGVSAKDSSGSGKRRIALNGLTFVLGFSFVFILVGSLAGLIGTTLVEYRLWLTRIGGILVILFGFFMLGVFSALGRSAFGGKISVLFIDKRMSIPKFLKVGHPSSSVVIGAAFAFGWTPCIGPILGSVLLLAGASSTVLQGIWLLAVFSLGLGLPFLLVAFAFSAATKYISAITPYLKYVSIVGGIFLILLGVLLITDNFGVVIQYGYGLFDFLNYDRLLDYL
ncbi:MAG TPA: cytochrome c biogenesis protein CcdA [Candidatus Paceibacterota bacterium]